MSTKLSLKETLKEWHGTLRAYLVGFILSLTLTIISFSLVVFKLLTGKILIYSLIGLAILQTIVQVFLFLHLGKEEKPRWETLIFVFTIMILLIVVIGSLWIMNDLDHRMMINM